MIVEALICFPLASLGSNWGQLSAFLGQSWTPQSLILDALPCLGNIFVAWDLPDAFEDRFFKTFDLNSADIPMQPKHLLCCWMTIVLRKHTPHRLHNIHFAESLSLQASESPSSLGGWRKAQTIPRDLKRPITLQEQKSKWPGTIIEQVKNKTKLCLDYY